MRHVPEEELHAYLDQALSRSQCVEIETHLARCGVCRDARDEVAAMRDRTTALLAALTPRPLILPVPIEQLKSQRVAPSMSVPALIVRSRRWGLWAAGVLAAIGAGWLGRSVTLPLGTDSSVSLTTALPAPTPSPTVDTLADAPVAVPLVPKPEPRRLELAHRPPARPQIEPIAPAPELTLVSSVSSSTTPALAAPEPPSPSSFDRLWRSVDWEEALRVAGGSVPFIEGLPVVGVLLQTGQSGERPAVIVSQQHPTGELLRSIEGPVAKVSEFLERNAELGMNASEPARTTPDYIEGRNGTYRALRALAVIGRLRPDSLSALARMAALR